MLPEQIIPILARQNPKLIALDGNVPEDALREVTLYCVDRGVPGKCDLLAMNLKLIIHGMLDSLVRAYIEGKVH